MHCASALRPPRPSHDAVRPARIQVPGQPAAATCSSQSLSHACLSPSHLKARAQIRPPTRTARLPGRPAPAALHQTRPRAPDTRPGHPIKHLPTSPAAPGTAPWASADPPIAPLSGALASRALRLPGAITALVTSRADILAIRPFTTASPPAQARTPSPASKEARLHPALSLGLGLRERRSAALPCRTAVCRPPLCPSGVCRSGPSQGSARFAQREASQALRRAPGLRGCTSGLASKEQH